LAADLAQASSVYCDGKNGYVISSVQTPDHWHNLTIKKDGAVVMTDLLDNLPQISLDSVTQEYSLVYRGFALHNKVMNSLVLSIWLYSLFGYTGIGDAVIFNGTTAIEVSGLNCQIN
jgi:hypothetical protein